MIRRERDLRRLAAELGWEYVGKTGGTHCRLRHPSGATYVTSGTPSDRRTEKNLRAHLRRIEADMALRAVPEPSAPTPSNTPSPEKSET